jgi:molybdopterin-guanine dinucleotide biosynthesis protein A
MNDEQRVGVFIQAGGQSSRMGGNKALLPLGDQLCIERVIAAARAVVPDLTLIANDPETYRFLGYPIISDAYRGIGPLGGVHTAVLNCSTACALILACDLPFITPELLRYLISEAAEYEAVVPKDAEGRLQPLCAVYGRGCLDHIIRLIESGEYKPRALFDHVRTRVIEFTELSSLPGADLFFFDMNTPESYEQAKAILR